MIGLSKYKPLKLCNILQAANSAQNKVAVRNGVTENFPTFHVKHLSFWNMLVLNSLVIVTDRFLTREYMSIITQCLGDRRKLPQYDKFYERHLSFYTVVIQAV